jgi:hypothetical protein
MDQEQQESKLTEEQELLWHQDTWKEMKSKDFLFFFFFQYFHSYAGHLS